MTVLPIRTIGDPVLRKRASEVEDVDAPGIQALIGDPIGTLLRHARVRVRFLDRDGRSQGLEVAGLTRAIVERYGS